MAEKKPWIHSKPDSKPDSKSDAKSGSKEGKDSRSKTSMTTPQSWTPFNYKYKNEVRRGSCHPLAHALHGQVKRTLAGHNAMLGQLLLAWRDIVAPEWAPLTEPISLSKQGVLRIAVHSAASLQFHYYTGVLLEMINLHMGQTLVKKITTVQNTDMTFTQNKTPIPAERMPAQEPPKTLEEALARLEKALLLK